MSAVKTASTIWDEDVLSDLLALPYVRGVVFTNGKGRAVHASHKLTSVDGLAKIGDLAQAALAQAGAALKLGALEVSACVYEDGVVLFSGVGETRCAVLADAGANLGTLLNHARRLFPEGAP
jgi:predicted regulator of Ras-like GTPase activity (Roadblock/LC7/MglB family)